MNTNVQEALNNVDMTYNDLITIVDDIEKDVLGDVDEIISNIYNNLQDMPNAAIKDNLLSLSLKSYSFSDIKEKSAFKAELAESIRKEAYAKAFKASEGTVAAKDSDATMNISSEIIAEEIHTLLSALFKTKLDEIHRVIDVLKTILMARLSEAKLVSIEG